MVFRYCTNTISQASKSFAAWIFFIGLLLIGFGMTILAFPAVFAFLAAFIFFVAGIGACGTALKIYLSFKRMDKANSSQAHRENVRIHNAQYFDTQ